MAPRRRPGHALRGGDVFVHERGVFECGLCQHHVHLELGVQTLRHRVWVVWGVFGPAVSTVVDISIPPPSFKPVSMSLPRSSRL